MYVTAQLAYDIFMLFAFRKMLDSKTGDSVQIKRLCTYIYQAIKCIYIIADHVGSITQSMCLNYSAFSRTAFVPKRSARDENPTASYTRQLIGNSIYTHMMAFHSSHFLFVFF